MEEEKKLALTRLEKFLQNLDTGMTRDKYLDMKEQLGQEPVESEIPPDQEDMPDIINCALATFSGLGDRMYPDIGYTGKDYTNLNFFIDVYGIEDVEFFLEILALLDSRAIKKSSDALKREYDKIKRKT